MKIEIISRAGKLMRAENKRSKQYLKNTGMLIQASVSKRENNLSVLGSKTFKQKSSLNKEGE